MLFVAGAYLVVGSLVIWPMVHTNPIEMLGQMSSSAEHYVKGGYSLNNLLEATGVSLQMAMKLAALLAIGLAFGLLWLFRFSSALVLYAIASVATRAWCYHKLYDNIILSFLLLSLGLLAWETRGRGAWTAFLLVGFTLWMPGRLVHEDLWTVIQWLFWVAGLAVLLCHERMAPHGRSASGPGPDIGRPAEARAGIAPAA
jgi:hypothetical protein